MEFLQVARLLYWSLLILMFSLLQHKLMAMAQLRLRPRRAFLFGLLQTVYDGLKLMRKEETTNYDRNYRELGIVKVIGTLFLADLCANAPLSSVFRGLGILLIMIILAYLPFFFGILRSSRYRKLAGARATSLILSYDLLFIVFFVRFGAVGVSYELDELFSFGFGGVYFPVIRYWIVAVIVECNWAPFDLVEAESEYVGGFTTDARGNLSRALIYAENLGIIAFSILTVNLFVGPRETSEAGVSFSIIICLLIWIRVCFPRSKVIPTIKICWSEAVPCLFYFFIYLIIFRTII